jgi:hypothetical protein
MTITAWLRRPEARVQLPAWLLLVIAIPWSIVRTVHVMAIHAQHHTPTHDLYTYYSIWSVFCQRDCADFALRGSLYLPHTWLFFTPLFILGWPAAQAIMFLINVAAVFFIWWRLSQLTGLQGVRRWLLLALFWSWSATGNVIGLGNLALVCLAAVVAAYPFTSPSSGWFLALSAMKQSLVFPLYFQLLFRRPKVLILPCAIFALSSLAILWWTRLSLFEGFGVLKSWLGNVSSWTAIDHTCLRRLLAMFIKNAQAVSVVMWAIWFTLFGITARWIKDPLSQLAALLLLCLLPMYHYAYDMVVAVPTLAVFMKRCPLIWPAAMSFFLACEPLRQLGHILPAGTLRDAALALQAPYLPLLILVLLGGLLYLEVSSSKSSFTISDGQASPGPAPTNVPNSSAESLGQA